MAKRRKHKHKNKPQAQSQPTTQQQVQVTSISSASTNQTRKSGVSLQTIEQKRAKHALVTVKGWESEGASDQKALSSYVVRMPAMILMSGFGQTCAFYKANKKDNHAGVLKVLEGWLGHGDLMDYITQSSAQEYQLAQAESLAYLNWLKKFTKAYLKDESEGEDDAATS